MRDKDVAEAGLTPDQQLLLMGKVQALEEALHAVALALPEDARPILRYVCCVERDNPQATANTPPPYRAAFAAARYSVFDNLARALTRAPDNDNRD